LLTATLGFGFSFFCQVGSEGSEFFVVTILIESNVTEVLDFWWVIKITK